MEKLNLYQKLNAFREKVGTVKKDGTNPHFKSKYATIESVLETIEKPLTECRLNYIQLVENETLKTIIYNVDNSEEKIESSIKLIGIIDMQKLGSAITYARRYGLVSMFGLEQEDDDGNATVQNSTQKTSASATTSTQKQAPLAKEMKAGDSCQCGGLIAEKTSKAGKPYWKCTSCDNFGFNFRKESENLDENIPF